MISYVAGTYAGGKQWKGLMTRREIEREICLRVSNEQSNRDYLRSVICIVVCLSWGVNHYRDNAIAYKEQRDKNVRELKLANAAITDMQMRQRDVAALDAKYTKELADAKAENDVLRDDVAAGRRRLHIKAVCQSVREATTASGVDNAASPRLADTAERDYSPSGNDW